MGSCEDWRNWSHQIGGCKKDPMSHRIIEKRRRDRMNNCLADLSRLIPAKYLKKGRGRIEKTEIIEMAIKHMKFLQSHTCINNTNNNGCEMDCNIGHSGNIIKDKLYANDARIHSESDSTLNSNYKLGYQECLAETMRFLIELQGFFPTDTICVKLISHLQTYYENISKGGKLVQLNKGKYITNQTNELDSKMNGYCSGISEVNDLERRKRSSSIITVLHSDDSYQENGTVNSQLREMLISPQNTGYTPSVKQNISQNSASISPPNHSASNDSHSSMYKFKKNIKERFSAENSNFNGNVNSLEKSELTPIVVCSVKRTYESLNENFTTEMKINSSERSHQNISRPVPIFALHAKGSFYVPLTIDSNLLTPFFTELNNDYSAAVPEFSPLLHPVTISVNFNRPMKTAVRQVEPTSYLSSNLNISPRIQGGPLLMVQECR